MQRLISFFQEPDGEYAPSRPPQERPRATGQEEPEYFGQILAYLRQRRRENGDEQREERN